MPQPGESERACNDQNQARCYEGNFESVQEGCHRRRARMLAKRGSDAFDLAYRHLALDLASVRSECWA